MLQYDGSIRIITKITTRDATESLSSLEWQICPLYLSATLMIADALAEMGFSLNAVKKSLTEYTPASFPFYRKWKTLS